MTMVEKFMTFAKTLPADQLESVEEVLAALMESHSEKYDLTADQLAELPRRVTEESPESAAKEAIGCFASLLFGGCCTSHRI